MNIFNAVPALFGMSMQQVHAEAEQEKRRAVFVKARERVLDELEIATVDCEGKRLKEKDVVSAMRLVARL